MMKNTKYLLTLIFTAAILFISCGKANSKLDANGCYIDIDDAIEAANKKNQDIMVIITVESSETSSEDFLNKVVRTSGFKNDIASKYAVVCMDFSQASYEATVAKEDADEAAKKEANRKAEIMQKNTKYAVKLNVEQTPVVYILSKEQYMICGLFYDDENRTVEGFKKALEEKNHVIDEMHKAIYQTKIGNTEEKVASIDALYEGTNPNYRFLLIDLLESVKKIDPSNKTGLLGKFLYAAADAKSNLAAVNGDIKGAVQAYLDIENEESIPAESRQQALYTAAYMCSVSGIEEKAVIIDYLERAIKLAPDSDDVPSINRVITAISAKD